jgi:hypothetical protein
MIGVGRIPEERIGHRVSRNAPRDDVTCVERQLCLEHGRTDRAAQSRDRIVRGNDDVPASQAASVGLDTNRVLVKLLDGGVLEDVATARAHGLRKAGQVLSRMKPRLIRELHARPANERDV